MIDAANGVAEALVPGERVAVSLQLDPSVSVAGAVREIAPQADAATRTRRVKIALDHPPEAFRLGATIYARLEADSGAAIRLPAAAVLREGEKTRVFVVDPQSFAVASRVIVAAPESDGRWIVRNGLKAGERVVIAGLHGLKEGQIVKIAEKNPEKNTWSETP